MQITLQNTVRQAKSFGSQSSGHLPLYMGGMSSIDLPIDKFLAYYDQVLKVTTIKNRSDGDCRLLIADERTPAAEIGCEALLAGILEGHMGADAQVKAQAWKDARDAKAKAAAQAAADRRAEIASNALRN